MKWDNQTREKQQWICCLLEIQKIKMVGVLLSEEMIKRIYLLVLSVRPKWAECHTSRSAKLKPSVYGKNAKQSCDISNCIGGFLGEGQEDLEGRAYSKTLLHTFFLMGSKEPEWNGLVILLINRGKFYVRSRYGESQALLDTRSLESCHFICSANIYCTAGISQNRWIHKKLWQFSSKIDNLIIKMEGQEKHRKQQKPVFAFIFRIRNSHTKA